MFVLTPIIAMLQIMVPFKYKEFIDGLTSQVKNNIIPISRIDDAVKRILRVKFAMGLFENPLADHSLVNQLGSQVSQLPGILTPNLHAIYRSLSCFRVTTTLTGA